MFAVFGLNGILMIYGKGFMPQPPMPPNAEAFFKAMSETGYMMPLISGTQLVAGLLVLTGLFVPLGLTLLAPVIVNIVLFHKFIEPRGLPLAWAVLGVEFVLVLAYAPAFRGVMNPVARTIWSRSPGATG